MILLAQLKNGARLSFKSTLDEIDLFWRKYPSLLYGITFFLGCWSAWEWHWALFIPLFFLLFPLIDQKHLPPPLKTRLLFACGCFSTAFLYGTFHYCKPILPEEGLQGRAIFEISILSPSTTHFGKLLLYQGVIKDFKSEQKNETIKGPILCTITIKQTKEFSLPPANLSYQIEGTLRKGKGTNYYSFHLKKETPFIPVKGSFGLAQIRYDLKKTFSNYIKTHFTNKKSADFLIGMTTGYFDNRLMSAEFGRFGLLHLLAISGFHFSILILCINGMISLFFSEKKLSLIILTLITLYFAFIGASASVFRAWVAASVTLLGRFIEKEARSLNSLGLALLVMLICDPLVFLKAGFQFSFAVTFSILLFYPILDRGLTLLFKKRDLNTALKMDSADRHFYIILTMLRKGLALTLAVNLAALPLTLYYFHKYPLMSFFYNLFFPLLVTPSIFLLLIGFVFPFIHPLNNLYTQFVLNFVYGIPKTFDFTITLVAFPGWIVAVYLACLFGLGIYLKEKIENNEETLFRYF